ncbi:MAG: phosphonate C-P lyase system protein PhnH [Acetobacterales bacterium]
MQGNAIARDDGLLPGFADSVRDSQRCFRAVLDAMSNPGRIVRLTGLPQAPAGLDPATAAVCLSLVDFETALWLPKAMRGGPAESYLRFHCGCPIASDASEAAFALVPGSALPELAAFPIGHDQYPDRSATVVLQVEDIRADGGKRLTGPGIEAEARLAIGGLDDSFWAAQRDNAALYPLGLDFIFTSGRDVAAMPRTTRVGD